MVLLAVALGLTVKRLGLWRFWFFSFLFPLWRYFHGATRKGLRVREDIPIYGWLADGCYG